MDAGNSSDEDKKDIEVENGLNRLNKVQLSDKRLKMTRTNSISILNGPVKVEVSHKIPIGFRTMSIRVTDTQQNQSTRTKSKQIIDLAALEWHKLSPEDVLNRLNSSREFGLDTQIADRRLKANGKNLISKPKSNLLKKIFWYLFGGFGGLLFICSIVCFIAWKPLGDSNPQASNLALACVLLFVLLLQAGFNAIQDFTSSRTMNSISAMLPTEILVLREGNLFLLPAENLVSGDIIKLSLGCKIPADIRLLEVSSDLKFDRSILTGESQPISGLLDCTDDNFLESKNIAMCGTLVVSGSGYGVCVALGDSTVFGRIAKDATGERAQKTTLEIEITRFVAIIGSFAIGVSIFIVILWAAWLRPQHPDFIDVPTLLINIVSVAVAFIPEGLPVCVTLSLTVIAGRMAKSKILCKSLSTVEALGCVSVLCSDKTGTLTQNKMTVVNLSLGLSQLSLSQAQESLSSSSSGAEAIKALGSVAGLCNDGQFESALREKEIEVEKRNANGDATDVGLLRFAEIITGSVNEVRSRWKEIGKVAFNSKNKFAIKLFESVFATPSAPILSSDSFSPNSKLLLVKGAPDIILKRCSHFTSAIGTREILGPVEVERILEIQSNFALLGQRVLILAKRVLPPSEVNSEGKEVETILGEEVLLNLNVDLTIVGLLSLVDPPRHDTQETIRICRAAGIRFNMVTGDFAKTALAIAIQVGIITSPIKEVKTIFDLHKDIPLSEIPSFDSTRTEREDWDGRMNSLVISGPEMITLNESQWKQISNFDEIVFARTTPAQKFQIVKTFQEYDCTVAVTGDGVNDAPALKRADVGVCVAGGSEVAMEASDLILLDQFSAITTGIQYGRLCFENLKKTILYLLPAGSFSELMPVLVNILFGLPQVLSNIQMILICVFTDVFPALSLVFEQPEADLLLRKPRDRKKDRLADWKLLVHAYLFFGLLESLTSMVGAFYFGFTVSYGIPFSALWLKFGNYDVDPDQFNLALTKAQSIYFFNLIIMQFFNLLATRLRRLSLFQQPPIFGKVSGRNLYLLPSMLISLALAIFFSYIPFFQNIFGTSGVDVQYFFLPVAYGTAILLLDEGRKYYVRSPAHEKSFLARIAW